MRIAGTVSIMKKQSKVILVAMLFLTGLAGCKTVEGVREDVGGLFDSKAEVSVPADRVQLVREVQIMLANKGFNPGGVDGVDGPATKKALHAFQESKGLSVTAGVTKESYMQLKSDTSKEDNKHEARDCVNNFKKQSGSLRNYRTTALIEGVGVSVATTRLVRQLNRNGYVINEGNPSSGQVNATLESGQTRLQISAFIQSRGNGSTVELNYMLKAGSDNVFSYFIPESTYRDDLCSYVDAMQGGN